MNSSRLIASSVWLFLLWLYAYCWSSAGFSGYPLKSLTGLFLYFTNLVVFTYHISRWIMSHTISTFLHFLFHPLLFTLCMGNGTFAQPFSKLEPFSKLVEAHEFCLLSNIQFFHSSLLLTLGAGIYLSSWLLWNNMILVHQFTLTMQLCHLEIR